jgi:hypothetical protein
MERPHPYTATRARRGRPAAHPSRLAGYALWLTHHGIPAGEVTQEQAVARLVDAARGHATLSPADALVVATDRLLLPPDIHTAAALLEAAAVAWLTGPGGAQPDRREGIVNARDLRPGARVSTSRLTRPFTVAAVDEDGPLIKVTATDGREFPLTTSGWLLDRTDG